MNECVPMLSLAGRPPKDRLKRILKYYYDNGIREFLIYPRSGCEIEYMSDEWREVMQFCIDYARENDMIIWLYDEFNWPSGSCDGRVAKENENYIAKRFVVSDDSVIIERMPLDECNHVVSPFCTDMFNVDAVKCFINLTHEKYHEWFGKYFGNTIKGIFTDEPSFSYCVANENHYPYYEGIEDDYSNISCRNIYDDILEYHKNGLVCFAKHYWPLLAKRFSQVYIKTIAHWCENHNLILTGHMLGDCTLTGSVYSSGDIFECLSGLHMPGVDELGSECSYANFVFSQIQSLRHNGKKYAMAELFAFGPCSMPAAKRIQMIWLAAAYGINKYFLAITHNDGRGNTIKKNYFNNFSDSNPNKNSLKDITKAAELAAGYADKMPIILLALRYPYDTIVSGLKNGNGEKCFSIMKDTIQRLNDSQIPWMLIPQNQESNVDHIINFSFDKITIENSDLSFSDADEIISYLNENIIRHITVTDVDGQLISKLLVRSYTDGSYIVVDNDDEIHLDRNILINGEKYTLPCFGVINDTTSNNRYENSNVEIENPTIEFNNKNVFRSNFDDNNELIFNIEEEIEVMINSRVYPNDSDIFLDGNKLEFSSKADNLTECFNEFYAKTDNIVLSKGNHIIKTDLTDLPFMPSIIIEGAFEVKENNLRPRRECLCMEQEKEYGFYDNASLKFDLNIPFESHNLYVSFDDNMLFCELWINGKFIEQKSYAPYVMEIPKEFYGNRINCDIRFYSSLSPLFGNIDSTKMKTVHTKLPLVSERIRVSNLKIVEL